MKRVCTRRRAYKQPTAVASFESGAILESGAGSTIDAGKRVFHRTFQQTAN